MTRKEKEERIQKEDGKAFETFNIKIDVTYLNPKYQFSEQTANVMSGNGLLKVFELNPSGDGPSFIGRWDGEAVILVKQRGMTWISTFIGFLVKRSAALKKGSADTLDTTRLRREATKDINTKSLFAHRTRRSSRELFALTYIARSEFPTNSPCATKRQ